jgi:hypothetical protein
MTSVFAASSKGASMSSFGILRDGFSTSVSVICEPYGSALFDHVPQIDDDAVLAQVERDARLGRAVAHQPKLT